MPAGTTRAPTDAALRRRVARADDVVAWSAVTVQVEADAAIRGEVRRAGAASGQRRRAEDVAGQRLERRRGRDAPPRQRARAGQLELRAPRDAAVGLVAVVHAADRQQEVRVARRAAAGVRDRAVGRRCRRTAGAPCGSRAWKLNSNALYDCLTFESLVSTFCTACCHRRADRVVHRDRRAVDRAEHRHRLVARVGRPCRWRRCPDAARCCAPMSSCASLWNHSPDTDTPRAISRVTPRLNWSTYGRVRLGSRLRQRDDAEVGRRRWRS